VGSESFPRPQTVFANSTERFDLIFVDGLHEYPQTLRDTLQALEALNPGGLVVVDDPVPVDGFSAEPDEEEALRLSAIAGDRRRAWNGDVFKVIAFLSTRPSGVGLVTVWSHDDSVQPGQTILSKSGEFGFSPMVEAAKSFVAPSYAEVLTAAGRLNRSTRFLRNAPLTLLCWSPERPQAGQRVTRLGARARRDCPSPVVVSARHSEVVTRDHV
jgi:hypothetical protein